uniref:Uncharacterized protein n=1 Tax=Caenorhabditis japonica TaxID=281687 RepID=A0A8R1E5W9_CAEJA
MSQFRNCKFRFIRAAKRPVAKRHSSESYVSCESSQFRKVTLRIVAEPQNQEIISNEQYAEELLPPAGKVELIHVKKKKCGCCSVQ